MNQIHPQAKSRSTGIGPLFPHDFNHIELEASEFDATAGPPAPYHFENNGF